MVYLIRELWVNNKFLRSTPVNYLLHVPLVRQFLLRLVHNNVTQGLCCIHLWNVINDYLVNRCKNPTQRNARIESKIQVYPSTALRLDESNVNTKAIQRNTRPCIIL